MAVQLSYESCAAIGERPCNRIGGGGGNLCFCINIFFSNSPHTISHQHYGPLSLCVVNPPERWPLHTICQKMEKSPQDISPSWHQIYPGHIQVMSLLPWMPQISHVLAAQCMLVGDIWHPLSACLPPVTLIPLRQTQNDCHFAGDIFKSIFLNEKIGSLMDISYFLQWVWLTIHQHWFIKWLDVERATLLKQYTVKSLR